jgi:indolepyruvate ferredoxin oxidoreductase beta subunit
METVNFVLGGLGGQGILFMTKILAQAALSKGFNIMGAETHGMAQRGGSVISHLRLGEVEGSLVAAGTAHFLLALDESEAYRNIPFLAEGGWMFANAEGNSFPRKEVKAYLEKAKVSFRSIPAGKLAMDLGAPMSTNLALLGYFAAFDEGPLSHGELRETVESVSPERFRRINVKVFDAGFERGVKEKNGYEKK